MFWPTNNICEYTFYPHTSKEAGNAHRIWNRTLLGLNVIICMEMATNVLDVWPLWWQKISCLLQEWQLLCVSNRLFLTRSQQSSKRAQTACDPWLSLRGVSLLLIPGMGSGGQAANPNQLICKNWASTPPHCPFTHLFSLWKNSGSRPRIPLTREFIRVIGGL